MATLQDPLRDVWPVRPVTGSRARSLRVVIRNVVAGLAGFGVTFAVFAPFGLAGVVAGLFA